MQGWERDLRSRSRVREGGRLPRTLSRELVSAPFIMCKTLRNQKLGEEERVHKHRPPLANGALNSRIHLTAEIVKPLFQKQKKQGEEGDSPGHMPEDTQC